MFERRNFWSLLVAYLWASEVWSRWHLDLEIKHGIWLLCEGCQRFACFPDKGSGEYVWVGAYGVAIFWKSCVYSKIVMFSWLFLYNSFSTRKKLLRPWIVHSISDVACIACVGFDGAVISPISIMRGCLNYRVCGV